MKFRAYSIRHIFLNVPNGPNIKGLKTKQLNMYQTDKVTTKEPEMMIGDRPHEKLEFNRVTNPGFY